MRVIEELALLKNEIRCLLEKFVKNVFGPRIFYPKNSVGAKTFLAPKKLGQKECWPKKVLGRKFDAKILVQKVL